MTDSGRRYQLPGIHSLTSPSQHTPQAQQARRPIFPPTTAPIPGSTVRENPPSYGRPPPLNSLEHHQASSSRGNSRYYPQLSPQSYHHQSYDPHSTPPPQPATSSSTVSQGYRYDQYQPHPSPHNKAYPANTGSGGPISPQPPLQHNGQYDGRAPYHGQPYYSSPQDNARNPATYASHEDRYVAPSYNYHQRPQGHYQPADPQHYFGSSHHHPSRGPSSPPPFNPTTPSGQHPHYPSQPSSTPKGPMPPPSDPQPGYQNNAAPAPTAVTTTSSNSDNNPHQGHQTLTPSVRPGQMNQPPNSTRLSPPSAAPFTMPPPLRPPSPSTIHHRSQPLGRPPPYPTDNTIHSPSAVHHQTSPGGAIRANILSHTDENIPSSVPLQNTQPPPPNLTGIPPTQSTHPNEASIQTTRPNDSHHHHELHTGSGAVPLTMSTTTSTTSMTTSVDNLSANPINKQANAPDQARPNESSTGLVVVSAAAETASASGEKRNKRSKSGDKSNDATEEPSKKTKSKSSAKKIPGLDKPYEMMTEEEKTQYEKIMKKRKRNAQSAARLRNKRRAHEADMEKQCEYYENRVAMLKSALEEQRLRADQKQAKHPLNLPPLAQTPAPQRTGLNPEVEGPLLDSESGERVMFNRRATIVPGESPEKVMELHQRMEDLNYLNRQVMHNLNTLRKEVERISKLAAPKWSNTFIQFRTRKRKQSLLSPGNDDEPNPMANAAYQIISDQLSAPTPGSKRKKSTDSGGGGASRNGGAMEGAPVVAATEN